jgi:hypothetical protein
MVSTQPTKSLVDAYKSINEATVVVDFGQGHIKQLEVDNNVAREILSHSQKITTDYDNLIDEWIKTGGWNTSEEINIIKPIIIKALEGSIRLTNRGVFSQVIKEIQKLTKLKPSLTNFESKFHSKNFLAFIEDLRTKHDIKIITNPSVVSVIKNSKFLVGTVSVGPGELLITLFSGSQKSDIGDIKLLNGQMVEIKGSGGRAGKGPWNDRALKSAADIAGLLKNNTYIQQHLSNITTKISKVAKNLSSKLSKFTPGTKQIVGKNDAVRIKALIDYIYYNANNLHQKNIEKIVSFNHLKPENLRNASSYFTQTLNINILPELQNLINDLNLLFKDRTQGGQTAMFRQFFELFNHSTGSKPIEELTKIISQYSMRPEVVTKDIKKYLSSNFGSIPIERLASQIIASLQLTDYQNKEKFTYLLFYDKFSDKQLVIGEFTDDYHDNFKKILTKSKFFNVDPTIVRGDGFGITINI